MNLQSDNYASRRLMPRVVFDKIPKNHKNIILVSGNLDYFIRYGLALINSHQQYSKKTALVINCVDFSFTTAKKLITKLNAIISPGNLFFCKTEIKNMASNDSNLMLCYYKTIRFYVCEILARNVSANIIVTDIDSLVVSDNLDCMVNDLGASSVTFGVGSTEDMLKKSYYEIGKINYLWRTIKAGFSYFKSGSQGLYTLKKINNCLFNFRDAIPPADALKLYRAYYGDQLALFFVSLELTHSPKEENHELKFFGNSECNLVSFDSDFQNSCLWIPPASKRNDSLFKIY